MGIKLEEIKEVTVGAIKGVCLIVVKSTYLKTYHLKMYSSLAFSACAVLGNY